MPITDGFLIATSLVQYGGTNVLGGRVSNRVLPYPKTELACVEQVDKVDCMVSPGPSNWQCVLHMHFINAECKRHALFVCTKDCTLTATYYTPFSPRTTLYAGYIHTYTNAQSCLFMKDLVSTLTHFLEAVLEEGKIVALYCRESACESERCKPAEALFTRSLL
jgi:hypothetical protein